jgi:predicted RNA-binding Zn-ribbon protein involved in translation (DUF1610 family)
MAYTRVNKDCPYCGNKMDNRAKQCKECYFKSLQKEGNPNFGKRYAKKYYCIDCNTEINWSYNRCHSCAAKLIWKTSRKIQNRDFTLDNNPNWIDGRSFEPYNIEFTEELKEQIRKRDNYECQNCGMTEEEHLIVYGQVLHIHHIDYNKKNCNKNNLISTCITCNTRANFNRDYWKKYYLEKIYELQNKS